MKKILSTLILLFIVCSSYAYVNRTASEDSEINFTEIILGQEKTIFDTQFGVNYYKYTATQDGILVFHPLNYCSIIFYSTDINGTNTSILPVTQDDENQQYYKAEVKQGETYYYCTSLIISSGDQFEVYYDNASENKITIKSSYNENDIFTPSGSNLELVIDRIVDIDNFKLIYDDNKSVDISENDINTSYFNSYFCIINLTPTVNTLINNGELNIGDSFTVRLENIRDRSDNNIIYGDNGIFELTLVLGNQPATVVSISPTNNSEIKNYYEEGSDEGFVTFTFSEDIKDNLTAKYEYGDVESGTYVTENIPVTVDGNTVTVNIQGIMFPEKVMTSDAGETQTLVTITLSGAETVSGNIISPNLSSSIGAVYKIVKENINFYFDLIPGNGSSVDNISEIVIWTNVNILFDNVILTYKDSKGNDTSHKFSSENYPSTYSDDFEGYVIIIPIEGLGIGAGDISLYVENARLMNGDSATIEATFKSSGTGINNVFNSDENVSVYNMDGINVFNGNMEKATESLEKGKAYIINGYKTILK